MSGLLLRTIFAVLAIVILFLIIPPLFALMRFPLDANVWLILRVCIAGLALLYIAFGRHTPPL